jgi:hypothetical protein
MNRKNNRMSSNSRLWSLTGAVGTLLGILGGGVAVSGAWLLSLGGSAY